MAWVLSLGAGGGGVILQGMRESIHKTILQPQVLFFDDLLDRCDLLNVFKFKCSFLQPINLTDTQVFSIGSNTLSSADCAEARRGWGRWIGEKEGALGTTAFPARFRLPSPQPLNCLHGQGA